MAMRHFDIFPVESEVWSLMRNTPGHRKSSVYFNLVFTCLFLLALPMPSGVNAMEVPVKLDFARHGDKVLALASFEIPAEYHAYSHTPGDTGKPTNLDLVLENSGSMPALYPAGVEEPDIYDPATMIRAYNGKTDILVIMPDYSYGKLYAGTLDMLLCSRRNCVPVKTQITGYVPEKIPLLSETAWKNTAEELLKRQGESSGAISLEEGAAPPPVPHANEEYGAGEKTGATQPEHSGPIAETDGFDLGLTPRYADENVEIYSLGNALLMGLLAGLLLNAMPCVLPVLTLKVSGLLLMGNMDDKSKIRNFRKHNICFAAGIISFFTALAMLFGLADFMWGQLYQSQTALLIMLVLIFLMGLSMLGVFTLPALDLRLGQNTRNPMLQSYLTGVVSTFLATPCSGPLLGGVLAWAFLQPLPVLMAVFWSVGLGMGLPYIAFSIWPKLARLLPKPGQWMHIFEKLIGFLLLGTSLYLLSILPQDKRMEILAVLLMTALGAWLWGAYCDIGAPRWRRRLGTALCLALLSGSIFWILQPARPAPAWQSFSPEKFARNIGRQPMLVEFTADWCPNCKFLEASVLGTKKMGAWQRKYGFELIKVDLTTSNPYAEKLLSQLGSRSIPLTALFPEGENASEPLVLRDIYGEKSLLEAMKEAFSTS